MTETEDAIIKELIDEVKGLREQNTKLVKKRNWFSKEMLGVYSAVIAGVVAWGNTYFQNISDSEVATATHGVAYKLLLDRQGEVEDICLAYSHAIIEVLPTYQRRRVERILEREGIEEGGEGAAEVATEEVVGPEAPEAVEALSVFEGSTEVIVEAEESEEVLIEEVQAPANLFEAIQRQVQLQDEVDIKKIEEDFIKKKVHRKK